MKQKPKISRPPKNEAIHELVLDAIKTGRYRFSAHALDCMRQRSITQMDVKDILLDGRREKRKDNFDPQFQCWKYAYCGRDERGRELRVVVAESVPGVAVITAIDLGLDD